MKLFQDNDQYIFACTFGEHQIPKAAGFWWDGTKRHWYTHSTGTACKLVKYAGPELAGKLQEFIEKREASLEASRKAFSDFCPPSPPGLNYLPYQRAGIEFMLQRENTWLADAMGLGKTIQAIGLMNADESIQKVLIVCPASLKLNWQREIEKWKTRPLSVSILSDGKKSNKNANILIVNYDILDKWFEDIQYETFDLLILDESHYIKSSDQNKFPLKPEEKKPGSRAQYRYEYKVKRVQAVFNVAPLCKRKVFLTGTPITNRPKEAWTSIQLLCPDEFPKSFFSFAKRYCAGGSDGFGFDSSGGSNLEDMQNRLRSSCMIRRLKEDVLTELPPKRRQIMELPAPGLTKHIQAENNAFWEFESRKDALKLEMELAKVDGDEEKYTRKVLEMKEYARTSFEQISKLRKETALAKLPLAKDFINDFISSGEKVVVFAHHHCIVDELMKMLNAKEEIAVALDGRMSQEQRQRSVDLFQSNPSVKVFIGSIAAAGVGITLTAASTVIFVELDWTPGNMSQAEDRCHRISQLYPVNVIHLVLEGSLDCRMAKILVDKQEVIDKALDRNVKPEESFDLEELEANIQDGKDSPKDRKEKSVPPAPVIPETEIEAIHLSLKVMARMCDKASRKDDAGFNGFDAQIGHELAARASLSDKQAAVAKKLLRKYHRQLPPDLFEIIYGKEAA